MEKNLHNINSESKAIDILRDSEFLRLFRYFILKFGKDYRKKDKNIDNLMKDFEGDDYLRSFKNKNDYNLFRQFYTFFNDHINKAVFFDTIKNFNIDEKQLNIFLNIGEYLQEIGDKEIQYGKEFYNAPEKYKNKIVNLLEVRDINDTSSILLQNGYSNISPYGFLIKDSDLANSIEYYELNSVKLFIWCIDEKNNVFYQDEIGDILKDSKGKIITHIDVSSIKDFGKLRVYSFINEDGEGKIRIDSPILGSSLINDIDGNSFNIKSLSYIDDVLGVNNEVEKINEKLDFLLVNSIDGLRLLGDDLMDLSVLDILKFLNKNSPLVVNTLEKSLDRLSEIPVYALHQVHNFGGVKFVELDCNIDSTLGYTEEDIEVEIKSLVLLENGKPLKCETKYGERYIPGLLKNEKFLDKEFVSFYLTESGSTDGYIDSFGKVIRIFNYELISLELLNITKKEKKYYKLNGDNDLIYSEDIIKRELSKYDAFNDNGDRFEIGMDSGDFLEVNKKRYDKIVGVIDVDGEINFYLQNGEYKEPCEYSFLLKNLKSSENGKKALKLLNSSLNMLGF